MVSKKIIPLVLLGLSSCTHYQHPLRVKGPDQKVRTYQCTFKQGRGINFKSMFMNSQLNLGLTYQDTRRRESISATAPLVYSGKDLAFTVGKQDMSLSFSPSHVGIGLKGLYFNPVNGNISTALLGAGSTGMSHLGKSALPFYLIAKAPGLIITLANYTKDRNSEDAKQRLQSYFGNVLFRDLLPFYAVWDGYYDLKRIFGISTSASGENLEEILQQFYTSSNSKGLSLIESNLEKYPELRGDLKRLYDLRILSESFLFSKVDIKDMQLVKKKVKQRLVESEKNLEMIIKKDGWKYLTDLYHVSGLADNQFKLELNGSCQVRMWGPYLFLADEGDKKIFECLAKIIEGYRKEGFSLLMQMTNRYIADTLKSLNDPSAFKRNYEQLYYNWHYFSKIDDNLGKIRHLVQYLGSRGKRKLAERLLSIGSLPRIKNRGGAGELIGYLRGIYDMVKKKEFPTPDHCDLLKNNLMNVKEIVLKYDRLDRKSRKLNQYLPIRNSFRNLLKEHIKRYWKEFNYHWHKEKRAYFDNTKKFWKTVKLINAYELDYGLKNIREYEIKEDYREMFNFYKRYVAKNDKVKGSDKAGLIANIKDIYRGLVFKKQVEDLGFRAKAPPRCDYGI